MEEYIYGIKQVTDFSYMSSFWVDILIVDLVVIFACVLYRPLFLSSFWVDILIVDVGDHLCLCS